jgi:exosome complex RNA-binding protein Rrp4
MAILSHIADGGIFTDASDCMMDVDLESGHKVLNMLVEVLQRNFKHDTHYARPLMSPQGNILFALDRDVAESMMAYMTLKLKEIGGFEEGEFRFVRKSASHEEVLQRLRLEFPSGVNAHIIRKLLIATDRLERILPAYTA